MSQVYDAKIVTVGLWAFASQTVKEKFGTNYVAESNGNIYVSDDKQPFSRYTGTWHVKDNKLYIEIINK